ncbi:MAG: hypothetical protein V4718_00570 [Pseudomonadota bacterium]
MNPLAWLNPGRWLLYLALAAALVVGYFAWADHIGDVREAKVRADYAKQAKAANDKRAAVAPAIAAKEAAGQVRIVKVTETILKEIPVYVKADDCPMPAGFRVLHDAAADGRLPDPAAIPDAASVPAQDVASTVTQNYGICHQTAQRLTSLQEWVNAQAALK